jgi:hypothetical protein
MTWSLKACSVGGFRYLPTLRYVDFLKAKRVSRVRLYKMNKIVVDVTADKDDTMSFVFVARVLAKARLAARTQLQYDGPMRLSGDVTSKLPAVWTPAGEKAPIIIIGSYSGGAHCCYTYTCYQLGKKISQIESPAGGDSIVIFGDFRGNGQLRAVAYDTSYGYWNACFADSPAPLVVLEFKNGDWRLAIDDMKVQEFAPKMVADALAKCQADIASATKERKLASEEFSIEPSIWSVMLEFIYTGHANEAWKFLDQVWPDGKTGVLQPFPKAQKLDKVAFKKLFQAKLREGGFFKELIPLNAGQDL